MVSNDLKHRYNIAIAGLAAAGKTSILKRITTGVFVSNTTPTEGFNTDTIERSNVKLLAADLGGQEVYIQTVWKSFLLQADILVYVVDASDSHKFSTARDVLQLALSWNPEIHNLIILANKQDLTGVCSPEEILERFEITRIVSELKIKNFRIFGTSAKTGEGLTEFIDWMVAQITQQSLFTAVNIQNVIVYQKTGLPVMSSQNPYAELVRVDLKSSGDTVLLVSGFYSALGSFAAQLFQGQIRTLEMSTPTGEYYKLVNVSKNDLYCLIVADAQDSTTCLESIGAELLDYVVVTAKNKKSIDSEEIRKILYPFIQPDAKKEISSGKHMQEYKSLTPQRRTVTEIVRQQENKEITDGYKKGDTSFFTKLSVMDRITEIEDKRKRR